MVLLTGCGTNNIVHLFTSCDTNLPALPTSCDTNIPVLLTSCGREGGVRGQGVMKKIERKLCNGRLLVELGV